MKIIETMSGCPNCSSKLGQQLEQQLYLLLQDSLLQCPCCGWSSLLSPNSAAPLRVISVPSYLEKIIKSLVVSDMFMLDGVDSPSFIANNEPATSPSTTIAFSHRVLLMSGCMTWYEVADFEQFQPHRTNFADLARYAPLPAYIVSEFVDKNSFLVSEAPGKKGRGLRNAGIRFIRYAEDTISSESAEMTKRYYTRSYLLWDLNYRRLQDGTFEKIAA